MKRVLLLRPTVLMHPTDIAFFTEKIQTDIDNGNVAIIPIWLKVIDIIGDEGEIKVILEGADGQKTT